MVTTGPREKNTKDADRREREEMFSISPEILAGGALPRRGDGSSYRADVTMRGNDRGDGRAG